MADCSATAGEGAGSAAGEEADAASGGCCPGGRKLLCRARVPKASASAMAKSTLLAAVSTILLTCTQFRMSSACWPAGLLQGRGPQADCNTGHWPMQGAPPAHNFAWPARGHNGWLVQLLVRYLRACRRVASEGCREKPAGIRHMQWATQRSVFNGRPLGSW